ncbi:MAG: ABC transporter permease subunit [Planktomarina sp.]|jgi:NitT/TauT family transport system permease protein|nr:ABC transporter permease subunit [Planktomarina sp.]MDA9100244.1 ABC transporter permease subunit [Planktomarina sp.]MDA9238192.1 ABC transporter permease subunit [Planktomarina sp.]MDC1249153.1 ABC transporter permease subunit [Planktomarina sp.]MDS9932547.1 ABC transporter permease subunit [Planktomarina sp.]|tara:strand:- start:34 stop:924 length:891 start_codon:yes stop_codon:yes gene_type:complete
MSKGSRIGSDNKVLPVVCILTLIVIAWYGFSVVLNAPWEYDKAKRNSITLTTTELVSNTWSQKRPKLPAPHQVVREIWDTTVNKKVTSKRSLVYHGLITFYETIYGFAFGTGLGILLALGIVYNRATAMSVMPWIITSQTIPILAIAPMIVVALGSLGFGGLLPIIIISMYLSFFPVVVGMVKGLKSPEQLEIDQMKTWSASKTQILFKLRAPRSTPYLFTSLKLGMAASLVGAIVGELPSGGGSGLGFRMLSGSTFGNTLHIWSGLFSAAILAGSLIAIISVIQRVVLKRMALEL